MATTTFFQSGTPAASRYEADAMDAPAFPTERKTTSSPPAHVDSTHIRHGDSNLLGEDAGLKALAFSGVLSAGAGLWVLGFGARVGETAALSPPASSSQQSAVLGSVLVVAGAGAVTTALGLMVLGDASNEEPR